MSLPVQHTLPVNIQYVCIIHPVSMTNLRISSQTLCDVSIRFVLSTFELKLKDIVELTNLRDKERCEERKRERGEEREREREGGREGDKHIVADIQVQDSLVHIPRLYYQLFQHLSVSRANTECASPLSNAGTKRRETDFAASYFCDASSLTL